MIKLPKEIIDAAASRFLDGLLPEKFQPTQDEAHTHRFMAYGREVANAAFEAAGVPALLEQIADYEAAYRKVMAEQCASDEWHCTCVPALRQRIAEAEQEMAKVREVLHDHSVYFEAEIEKREARIAELEAEKAQASAGGGE